MRRELLLGLAPLVVAIPAEPTAFGKVAVRAPESTPAPKLSQRDVVDDIELYENSITRRFRGELPSFINSGILDYPNGFPTGTAVKETLAMSDDRELDALPTQVLNVPAYANWTRQGWNVRVHGNVYKTPNISTEKIDRLASNFLVDTELVGLSDTEKAQARNVTKSIYVVQQANESVTIDFVNNVSVHPGEAIDVRGARKITVPNNTTALGEFDAFVQLKNMTRPEGGYLIPGDQTSQIQTLNMYAGGPDNDGNSTAYFVPPEGITVLSDIDDILRITRIYRPVEGLLNTFARPFTPWLNMPEIFANWASSIADLHFHYMTTTPEQLTRTYMDFIYKTYPLGSFDTRPINCTGVSATMSIRKHLLRKIFQTFPKRRFILIGDTSNSDVMKEYPDLYHRYPDQVLCIFIRNTTETDPGNIRGYKFIYNTEGFKGIPQDNYMFFTVPDDLANLDIENGRCWNQTIAQKATFNYQGLPRDASIWDRVGAVGQLITTIERGN